MSVKLTVKVEILRGGNFRAFHGKMVRRENKTAQILCQNVCLCVQACSRN